MRRGDVRAFGTLTAVEGRNGLRIDTPGYSSPNVRLASAIHMMRDLLALARDRDGGAVTRPNLYVFQFDDHAHHRIRSVALGREAGLFPLVKLIVDPYFFFTRGFEDLRRLSETNSLVAWSERRDLLFWRGRGSHNGLSIERGPVRALCDVPRVSLALKLRDHSKADVGLIGAWMQPQSDEETIAYFQEQRIFRPYAPMVKHAHYKFQLDIDGVANAWALLERFLCGSCVLKVGSPFEMWFYDRIRPWKHYVPIRADLTDLEEKLDWCLAHDDEAHAIAAAGQSLALSLTYDYAVNAAVAQFAAVALPCGERC